MHSVQCSDRKGVYQARVDIVGCADGGCVLDRHCRQQIRWQCLPIQLRSTHRPPHFRTPRVSAGGSNPHELLITSGTSSNVFGSPSGSIAHWNAYMKSVSGFRNRQGCSPLGLNAMKRALNATPMVSAVAASRPIMVPVTCEPCELDLSPGNLRS
jgi:hypothetical protein